jgi:hypothetical protein
MGLPVLLQAVPSAFVTVCTLPGLVAGSFSSGMTRQQVSLH